MLQSVLGNKQIEPGKDIPGDILMDAIGGKKFIRLFVETGNAMGMHGKY